MSGGEGDLNTLDGLNEFVAQFYKLVGQAENNPKGQTANPITYELEIEITEVLCVGGDTSGTPDVAIVKDRDEKIWIISECEGVKSRRDVGPGMKLRLIIEDNVILYRDNLIRFRKITKIVVLNAEKLRIIKEKCSME